MGLSRKFLFDVSFDEPDPPPQPEAGVEAEAAFVRADIDAARMQGYAEGREAALVEAAEAAAARSARALDTIAGAIARLFDAQRESAAAVERNAVELVRAVLQKAVPALCRRQPLAEFEGLIAECLGEALDEPRLVLRVADSNFDAIETRLGPMAKAAGYSGKLVLIADAALADGDGRIEWADGGAERNVTRLLADLDAMFARILSEETPDG